jgi:hypothetical protein
MHQFRFGRFIYDSADVDVAWVRNLDFALAAFHDWDLSLEPYPQRAGTDPEFPS